MKKRKGFTLVELVVVIMIIAILGAAAAPRLMGSRRSAVDAGLIQSLAAVRNAITMYSSENGGALPRSDSVANFHADVELYLRGPFPTAPVGTTQDDQVEFVAGTPTSTANAFGWVYSTTTGEIVINEGGATVIDPSMNYDEL